MLEKTCTNCNKTFYVIKVEDFSKNFHKAKLGKYGFNARCKPCRNKLENIYQKPSVRQFREDRNCIVCNKVFTPRRDIDTTCGKECSGFRTKIARRLDYDKYLRENRKLAKKEILRKNKMKRYTKKEVDFIMENRGTLTLKQIAKKLDRTTRSIILKIHLINKKETNNG